METDLVIRAILLKNNEVIFNYSFRIQGTDYLHDATIAATNKVCNLFLGFALKGDTLVCSLGAGHNSARTSITTVCPIKVGKDSNSKKLQVQEILVWLDEMNMQVCVKVAR